MLHQQILKGCLLGITDPKDQRHPLFAKCLLCVKQCNAIVDEINLLSKREVIYQQMYPEKQIKEIQNQFKFLKLKLVVQEARSN